MRHLTAAWRSLSLEDGISVAEMAMERGGLVGKTIDMPVGHRDDPIYQAAIRPLIEWVSGICGRYVNIYYSAYTLKAEGNPIAVTDGYNWIVVRQRTNEMTILHECAHIINRTSEGQGHDEAFARTARDLYARHISREAADVFWNLLGLD